MPSLADLTPGTIFQGNNGDKWIVQDGIQSKDKITVEIIKLAVDEQLIKE